MVKSYFMFSMILRTKKSSWKKLYILTLLSRICTLVMSLSAIIDNSKSSTLLTNLPESHLLGIMFKLISIFFYYSAELMVWLNPMLTSILVKSFQKHNNNLPLRILNFLNSPKQKLKNSMLNMKENHFSPLWLILWHLILQLGWNLLHLMPLKNGETLLVLPTH